MKRQVIIKDIEIEFIKHSDNVLEGTISFLAYEDSECRHPSSGTYGFAAYDAAFMSIAADFFSIFPVKSSAFIVGRKIEIEFDDKDKHIISIRGLDTGRVFNANKYSESKPELTQT